MFVTPVKTHEIIQFHKTKHRQELPEICTTIKQSKIPALPENRYGVKNALENYDYAESVFRNNLAHSRGIFGKTENIDKLIQNDKIRKNVVVFFNKYAQEQIEELDKKKILTLEDVNKRKDLEQVRIFFSEFEETWKEQEPELFAETQSNFPMVSFARRIKPQQENKCKNIIHAYSGACGLISAALGEGAAIGADTPLLRVTQFIMFAQLQNELNVPILASLEYYTKEMCAGATLGVGGAKLAASLLGIGAHTVSVASGTSISTGGASDAAITGSVRGVNAALSTMITEKMGRGYIRKVKQNRMNLKDQTIEAGLYFTRAMLYSGETNPVNLLNNIEYKDPSDTETIKDVLMNLPKDYVEATSNIINTISKQVINRGSVLILDTAISLITLNEKDTNRRKQAAKKIFRQCLIRSVVYELCSETVEYGISKEAKETIEEMQNNLEKYPEVFKTFIDKEHEFIEQINLDTLDTKAFVNQFKNKIFMVNYARFCNDAIREVEIKWVNSRRQKQFESIKPESAKLKQEQIRNLQSDKLSKEEQEELDCALKDIEYLMKTQQAYFKSQKGFGYERIAGYDQEKEELSQKFILPLSLKGTEIEIQIPGAILLYGPTGVGKTELAKSVAEQGKCKLISFHDVDTVEELSEYLKTLKQNAKNSNRHTVIKIDEFDDYGSDPETAKLFKEFIQEAPNHNITLFLTTNNPLDIDKNLLKETLNIPINPANKENILAILRFYADNISEDEAEQIADKLIQNAGNNAYSNSQLRDICQKTNLQSSLNKAKFMLQLTDKLSPEIKEKDILKFTKEQEKIRDI